MLRLVPCTSRGSERDATTPPGERTIPTDLERSAEVWPWVSRILHLVTTRPAVQRTLTAQVITTNALQRGKAGRRRIPSIGVGQIVRLSGISATYKP